MATGGTPSPRTVYQSLAKEYLVEKGYHADDLSLLWASGDIDILMKATFGFRCQSKLIYIEVKGLSGGRHSTDIVTIYDWDKGKNEYKTPRNNI